MSGRLKLPYGYARRFYETALENMNTRANGWGQLTAAERKPWIERAREAFARELERRKATPNA